MAATDGKGGRLGQGGRLPFRAREAG